MAGLIGSLIGTLTSRGQNYNDPRYNNNSNSNNYYNDGRQYPANSYQYYGDNNYDARSDYYPQHGQPCSCADCAVANRALAAGMPLTRHERRQYHRAERHAWRAQRAGIPMVLSPGPVPVAAGPGPGFGCGRGAMARGPVGAGTGRRRGGLIRTVAQEIGNALENRGSGSSSSRAQPRAGEGSRSLGARERDRSIHRSASFDDVESGDEGAEDLPPSYDQATRQRRSVEVLMPDSKASRR